jgi:hypothetical protein
MVINNNKTPLVPRREGSHCSIDESRAERYISEAEAVWLWREREREREDQSPFLIIPLILN